MYAKYSDGSAVTLVQARYTRTDPQDLTAYHVPLTDINGAIPLGLNWQTWTISGVITDPMSVRWRDIVLLSLDNVSWRTCRYQTVGFPSNMYQQSLYELTMLVSPLLEGAIVRYPTTGYLFGNQGIAGLSQAGNVNAKPTIHYLAPLFYAPLSNTLVDFTGQSVTFTRTASKVRSGVLYPINTPIFDNGLYLGSDTAQDVATWIPPAAAVRTIAMQIKSRYPSPWVIGGSGGNLLTANQSNAETDTTGMAVSGGTLTRNTVTPIVGTGDFKVVATGGHMLVYTNINAPVTAGRWYSFQAAVKCVGMASGRQLRFGIAWFNAAAGLISQTQGNPVACQNFNGYMFAQAPANAVSAQVYPLVPDAVAGETMYVDNLMLETIPNMFTVWTAANNKLRIHTILNLLQLYDDSSEVLVTFPTAEYLNGAVTDIIAIEDTSHAVTLAVHLSGGSWTSASGTLAYIMWPQLTLGCQVGSNNLEGSIANLIEFPYVLTSAEYQAIACSSLSLLFNGLYIGNRYAGEIIKGSDKRLLNASGADISALLGGTDIPIGSAAVTISQTQGMSARWYVDLKRTDV